MKRCMLALGAVAMMSLAAVASDPIWVDDDNYGKSGLDGKSPSTAYGTIQDAVDNAAAGDTIRVMPGLYDKGGEKVVMTGATPARVGVLTDNLTIVAEDKAPGATVIRGRFATGATGVNATACGDDSVGCVAVKNVQTFRMEGFTLENGATQVPGGDTRNSYGGAFHGCDVKPAGQVCLVDCTVRDCASGFGVLFGVTFIRSSLTGCFASNGTSSSCISRQTWFYNSLVAHNYGYDLIGVNTYAINTTFADNGVARRFCRSNAWIYNCVVLSSGAVDSNLNLNDHGVTTGYQVMGTATDDWRLIAGCEAATAGTADNLAQFAVPEGDRYLDFFGKPIPTSGTIAAGAVQEVATPAGGGLVWSTSSWTVDGKLRYAGSYAFPSVYPTQYLAKVQLPAGKYLMRYKVGSSLFIASEMDDSAWMMPSPDPTQVDTVVWEQTSTVVWVDDEKGDDDTATGTEALPYKTIQAAVAATASGSRIHVKKGVYDEGGDYGQGCSNRVQVSGKTLRIIGVDGKDVTTIVGAKDETTLGAASMPGCGPAAMRCLYVGDGFGQLQGFTLQGGRTGNASTSAEGQRGGGVWMAGTGPFYVTDCTFSDCRGGPWGTVRAAFCQRCRFEDCHGTTSMFSTGVPLSCCEFDADCGCEYGYKGISYNPTYHCSFAGAAGVWPYSEDDANTHVADVVGAGYQVTDKVTLYGCVFGDITVLQAPSGFVKADPLFVDPATADLRTLVSSPVFTAGEAMTAENYGASYYKYMMTSDIDGNRISFPDGKPVAGAHMKGVPGVVIAAGKGGLSVTGGKVGVNALETPEASVSIAPSWEATRPCIGFAVGGVTNLFDDLAAAYTITGADVGDGAIDVAAIYTSDWYVDAENGADDAAHVGFTPKTAKRTLEKAMALPVSGDTVHALPGVYSNGTMLAVVVGDTICARVSVPNGVTLTADAGPEATVIEGAAATVDPDQNGCGADAVRCVQLMPNTRLRGFTLRGGRVSSAAANTYDCSGGGVLGYNYAQHTTIFIEDCTITDCVASRGAGGRYGTYVNCRFFDNRQTNPTGDGSCGTFDAALYGCVFDRNTGRSLVYGQVAVVNCTLAANNSVVYLVSTPNVPGCQKNSIIMGPTSKRANNPYYRCLVLGDGLDEPNMADGTRSVTSAEMAFDANYRPVVGANAAIDMANDEYFDRTILGDADAFGGQRIYNDNKLDIGAVEADWRPRYAKDIRGSRFTVDEATPGVAETADGTVRIAAGETLKATLAQKRSADETYTLSFTVNDGSALTVTVNGVEHVYDTAGAKTLKVTASEAENALAFACTAGSADIASLKSDTGTLLLLR